LPVSVPPLQDVEPPRPLGRGRALLNFKRNELG
jgi:hypothetical protein